MAFVIRQSEWKGCKTSFRKGFEGQKVLGRMLIEIVVKARIGETDDVATDRDKMLASISNSLRRNKIMILDPVTMKR